MWGSKWRWGRILLALAEEMELRVGDKIYAQPMERYNFHNGYSNGKNQRSSRVGHCPLYKVEE